MFPNTSKEQLEIAVNVIEQALFTPLEIREYLETSFIKRFSLQRLDFVSSTQETLVSISQHDQPLFAQENSLDYLKKVLDQVRGDL